VRKKNRTLSVIRFYVYQLIPASLTPENSNLQSSESGNSSGTEDGESTGDKGVGSTSVFWWWYLDKI